MLTKMQSKNIELNNICVFDEEKRKNLSHDFALKNIVSKKDILYTVI